MIPRFKPSIGTGELAAALRRQPGAVVRFERAFADQFGASDAISFNYGRGGLFAMCKGLGLEGAEIVIPAYTCSVVAHAVVVSGNTCRFVDSEASGFNMDLAQLESAIGERTRMVIATHLFGFPADVDRIQAIVDRASQRWGHKIWVVQDCAHAFGARWRGLLVSQAGDVALFGLGISKMMTSIFGGMLTTSNSQLASKLRAWRDANFREPSASRRFGQRAYLAASAAALSVPLYGFVRWLQDETSLLDSLTRAYHLDGMIRLPPEASDRMSDVEAQVGLAQLARYPEFEARRREHARFYREHLTLPTDWVMPPDVEGATYSHFPIWVADRDATLKQFLKAGIQLGQLIEYSVPHLSEYGAAAPGQFPNSWSWSQHTINLPVHPDLSESERASVVALVNSMPSAFPVPAAKSL
jgi:dTDP-4-amino-4,6-dideoxygalactose transaminase